MRALWLADVLRQAGLRVYEVAGWKTRGADSWGPVRGITCHHTAGSRNSSIEGELRVLVHGRPGLSGPIAQLLLARNGAWYVVASGTSNHNKVGWDGPNEGYGNDALLGIEAQHSGGDEPWTGVQYESYVRGVAALVRHKAPNYNVVVSRVAGHKEHQPGAKSDPTFNMGSFRRDVTREIADWNKEDDFMASIKDLMNYDIGAHFDRGKQSFGGAVLDGNNRAGYLANVFAPAVLAALAAQSAALQTIRQLVTEGEVADQQQIDAVLAKVDLSQHELAAAIAGIPDSCEPSTEVPVPDPDETGNGAGPTAGP